MVFFDDDMVLRFSGVGIIAYSSPRAKVFLILGVVSAPLSRSLFSLIRFRTATLQNPNNDSDIFDDILDCRAVLTKIVCIIDVEKLAR